MDTSSSIWSIDRSFCCLRLHYLPVCVAMTQAFVVVKFTRLTLATRIVQLAAALNTRSTSHAPPRGSAGSCLSIRRRSWPVPGMAAGGGGVNSLEPIRIGAAARASHHRHGTISIPPALVHLY